jgi:hypothetical protein
MLITALYVCMYVCICDYVNICMSCAAMYIAPQSLGLLLHKNRIQIKFSYLILSYDDNHDVTDMAY